MPTTVLVDTNVLVYRHDPRDRTKQERAREVFRRLVEAERATTSAQCLAEFYRVVTHRLPEAMSASDALAEIGRSAEAMPVLEVTAAIAIEACRGSAAHKLPVWDAIVWASAKLGQIPYVLTEDAPHGRAVEGVVFLDPFDPTFDLDALVR